MHKVLLIGDSIRLRAQPLVVRRLAGRSQVVGPAENAGDSRNVRRNLTAWLRGLDPDVVHINFGLHDLKMIRPDGRHQVPLVEYADNVEQALTQLRELAGESARLIWATITPVRDECYARRRAFTRCRRDVDAYNAAALASANRLGYEINDLHAAVIEADILRTVCPDGVHMTGFGNEVIAEAIARCICASPQK